MGDSDFTSLYKWEEAQSNVWEKDIQEDASGNIINVNKTSASRSYIGRTQQINQAVRRGLIRYMVLAIDCCAAASEKDYRPNRIMAMKVACERFILHYFDQNPISQLCLAQMQDSVAKKLTDMSGNPKGHVERLRKIRITKGLSSLQNIIKLSILALRHVPTYGHRELLVVFTSLSSTDPGNIDETISEAVTNNIRICIVSLTAEIFICKKICEATGGTFSVAVDNKHLVEILESLTSPSPQLEKEMEMKTDFVYMGFPSRVVDANACYVFDGKTPALADTAYICPRCFTRTTDIPTQCHTCTLQLNSSSHIARSFHHIFPVPTFEDTMGNIGLYLVNDDLKSDVQATNEGMDIEDQKQEEQYDNIMCGACSDILVYSRDPSFKCPRCGTVVCADCDRFIHESLHNCPGC